MVELKDEILDTSSQSIEVPLFNVKNENGSIIHSKVQIELATPVVQEGNDLNKEFWEEIGFHAGMILMWSGSIATIPKGWSLCDGSNGTPDLRNRFIVGAGSTYSVGTTGGSNTVTLSTTQIPSHTHTASSASAGSHEHSYDHCVTSSGVGASGSFMYGVTGPRAFDTDSAGAHTHTITVNNSGGGQSHENRPPYYALAYIMKI